MSDLDYTCKTEDSITGEVLRNYVVTQSKNANVDEKCGAWKILGSALGEDAGELVEGHLVACNPCYVDYVARREVYADVAEMVK